MADSTWDTALETGDELIDHEHRLIFRYVDELNDPQLQGYGADFVNAAIAAAIDYAGTHFAREEALMKRTAYPWLKHHAAIHRDLTEEVQRLREELTSGVCMSAADLATFLSQWFTEHIDIEDRKFIAHVRAVSGRG